MAYKEIIDPAQLEGIFGKIDFPIAKGDILQRAEQEGADDDVVMILGKLPEKIYVTQFELNKEIGKLK